MNMKLLLKINSERTRKRYQRADVGTTSSLAAVTNTSSNAVSAQPRITQSRTDTNTTLFQKFTTTSKFVILLIIMVIITTGITIYVEITKHRAQHERDAILFGNNYDHDTLQNLGNGHRIVDRNQWGSSDYARPLTIPLKHPVPYVLITHVGVQQTPCENIYDCSVKMRTIQDAAIAEKKLPDINANFYVAGDGNVYVGSGWNYANTYANDTLAITFLGDYGRYHPNPKQLDATKSLLTYAEENKYLSLDYKIVAQNQTKSSKSPGVNVYRQIVKWPHFYPCGQDGNPKCGSELGMPVIWDGNM